MEEILSNPNDLPVSYKRLSLILFPGLVGTVGLIIADFSSWALAGIGLLVLFLTVGWLINNRRFPDWGLLAAGMLMGVAQPFILSIIGVIAVLVTGTTPSPTLTPIIFVLPWLGIAIIFILIMRSGKSVSKIALFAGLISLCCVLVRVKYFVLYGISQSILWEMLGISLWAAGTLILPIMLIWVMPRRFGSLTILYAAGATFIWYQILIDNGYKVSASIDSDGVLWAYHIIVRLLFVVIGPWLFLRLSGMRKKLLGLILCMCASVVINIAFSGLVRGDFTLMIWLSAIPYTISICLSPLLAFWLYREANGSLLVRELIVTDS